MATTATTANPCEGGLGNTVTKPPKSPEAIRWVLTWNNYNENEFNEFATTATNLAKGYIFGKEVGENGTPHIQGYIEFKKKIRLTALKKLNIKIHWEIAKGNREQNINYCSKDNNFICHGEIKIKKPLKIINELYPWQKQIEEIAKSEPSDRKIYWFYDEIGNMGKTQFSKYMSHHYNAVPIEGKKNDILYCCAEFESDIYIYDIERSLEEYVSYGAIEKIKNGYYMCSKYESKPIIRNSPHIFIFANFLPKLEALSKDRWEIYNINDKYGKLYLMTETDIEYEKIKINYN